MTFEEETINVRAYNKRNQSECNIKNPSVRTDVSVRNHFSLSKYQVCVILTFTARSRFSNFVCKIEMQTQYGSMNLQKMSFRRFKRLFNNGKLTNEQLIEISKHTADTDIFELMFDHENNLVIENNIACLLKEKPKLKTKNGTYSYLELIVHGCNVENILKNSVLTKDEAYSLLKFLAKTHYVPNRGRYSATNIDMDQVLAKIIKQYPNTLDLLICEFESMRNYSTWALPSPEAVCMVIILAALKTEGLSNDIYEKLYSFTKAFPASSYRDQSWSRVETLLHYKHLPASVLYYIYKNTVMSLENDKEIRAYADLLKNHVNLSKELALLLPAEVREYALEKAEGKNIGSSLFKEKKLAKVSEVVNSKDYAERLETFNAVISELVSVQHLAEVLVKSLSKTLPLNLEESLHAVKLKTDKLEDFYENVLTSPCTALGDEIVLKAKEDVESMVTEYEEFIIELSSLRKEDNLLSAAQSDFDKLKAETKACVELQVNY